MNHLPGSSPPGVLAPLYGREHDLSQLLSLLHSGVRLLTLRGPGGIGKTALAVHLAHALKESGQFDHVQFVDLSAVREPERVMGLIAASLPGRGFRGTLERRIQNFVASRRTVLVLDNFEQLLPAAPGLGDLLASTGTLHLVVTSRAALRLHDETEYPVEPLALPQRVQDAASSAAVRLFVARMQTLTPSFVLDDKNAAQVTRLCEVLEGVPLALELAAMRTRTYALGDLLARLEHPLDILKADFRDRPERLRSLRAAVQWSYDLLGNVDRAVFECCAVFSGSFSPQALAEVWGSPEVLERAEALLEQSLLQRLETPETLWRMLQPLRELALEHLEGHPLVHTWRDRHALYFLEMIEEYISKWQQSETDDRVSYLPHYPNIRAGMIWVTEQGQADLAYRYLCMVGFFYGPFRLAAREVALTAQVLALPAPKNRRMLLRALQVSIFGLMATGQFQAAETRLREMLSICQEPDDLESAARANIDLAEVELATGRVAQAWNRVEQVLHGEPERMGGGFQTFWGRISRAFVRLTAASCLLELGRHEEALNHATLARQYFREVGNQVMELEAENLMGLLMVYLNRQAEAVTLLLNCLHKAAAQDAAQGFRLMADNVLSLSLTRLAAEVQDWRTLVQFAAFVSGHDGEPSQSVANLQLRRDLEQACEAMGDAGFQAAWASGTRLLLPEAVELAERLAQRLPTQASCTPPRRLAVHPDLTHREQEVLALVAQGYPDRKIARLLNITPGTASKHVGNLLGKLGLHNRVELARWAMKHLPPDGPDSANPPGQPGA